MKKIRIKQIIIPLFLIIIFVGIFYILKLKNNYIATRDNIDNKKEEIKVKTSDKISYSNDEYLFGISYPSYWGVLSEDGGYNDCPEDDTYRTQEYLPIRDKIIFWNDENLPESNSFISRGVKIKYLNSDGKICGNDLLKKLSTKEIVGEILSSVQLNSIENGKFYGVYNKEASRLNTEHTETYTLFSKDKEGKPFVLQAYISFVPYYESRELKELEGVYGGNMDEYINKGETSGVIREKLNDFRDAIMSIN